MTTPIDTPPGEPARGSVGSARAFPERALTWATDTVLTALKTFGAALVMCVRAGGYLVTDTLRGRLPLRETIAQSWFIVSVTAIPAVLVSVPFGVIVSVQVGSLTQQVGATSMAGAAGGIGVIQQGAPIVSALLLGGAAGSAVAADLGARTIREEIDALRTMGIDPVRRLVAPRLAAMLSVAPLLCILIVFMGVGTGYVINVVGQDGTPGSYISSFVSFASMTDLFIALVKAVLFGLIVLVVACQRGLMAEHGPRGVANAVNASVVLGVIAAFMVNLVITQLVSMFLPQRIG